MSLPIFLIIGAPKAGTTSLYKYLQAHPQVFMPEKKEPHFFSFEGRTTGFNGPGQKKFMEKRVTKFTDYQKLFDQVNDEVAIGEASTSYLYIPEAAERIKKYIPETQIITILRQPVDRAYSHYLHHFCNGGETNLTLIGVIREEKRRQKNNWSPFWQYQEIGFYYQHLCRFFELFNKEQIKVFLYDDLCQDSLAVMRNMYAFLGIQSEDTLLNQVVKKIQYFSSKCATPQFFHTRFITSR